MRPVRQIWDKVKNNKTYHADLLSIIIYSKLHHQKAKVKSISPHNYYTLHQKLYDEDF
jgi:hypothetical protein